MAKVSVVIPVLNEEKFLPDIFACLNEQTFQDFEVIVADAGSTDNSQKIALDNNAVVVNGDIPGLGRNNGASVANGEILIFMDADILFAPDFLAKSVAEFEEQKYDLAVALFDTNHSKLKYRILFRNGNFYKNVMRHTRFPDGTGQLVVIKSDLFRELGGYNDWRVAEDTELFWRAAKQKHSVGVLKTKFVSSVRRYEKFGIFWIFTVWGLIGMFMILGVYSRSKSIRSAIEKLYGSWGKWNKKTD